MNSYSPGEVPIVKGDRFSKCQCPKNEELMKQIPKAFIVGRLMYVNVPDLTLLCSKCTWDVSVKFRDESIKDL